MSTIRLEPVTRSNWRACAAIKLPADQVNLVAPTVDSIAESKFESHFVPRAICQNEKIVGFLMYCPETDPLTPELFWLFRFTITPKLQNRGIGRSALRLAIEEMKQAGAARIRTMHKPSNEVASRLYQSAGFTELGVLADGDISLELDLR